jgi:ATP-dependent Clp protease ATP-binding subunit ClpC
MLGESTESVGAGVGGGSSSNKMPTLEEYGTNLTKLAEEVLKCVETLHPPLLSFL